MRYSAKAIRAKREMQASNDPDQTTYFASTKREDVWSVVPSEYGPAETPSDSPDALRDGVDALHISKRARILPQDHLPTPSDATIRLPQSIAPASSG